MKLFKNNKGQLIIYFLVACTAIALLGATAMQFRMQEIKRQMRIGFVSNLKAECDGNMAQCRIAAANLSIYLQTGDKYGEPPIIRTKAMKNILKVVLKEFRFSAQARLQWQGFTGRMNEYGLLKDENTSVEIDPRDCEDVYQIYYDLKLFLVKSQANNYTFDF